MLKLLYYGESGLNPTGFGTVNRHILAACSRVCDVTHVATTHYYPDYDHDAFPYEIIGCDQDVPHDAVGQRNLRQIERYIKYGDWDIFFYQGDMGANNDVLQWAADRQKECPEKNTIFYMPIDGDTSLGFAFAPFAWCTVPVVYTNHAKSVIEKYAPAIAEKTSVIWLGCEADTFYPLSEEERRAARLEFFGEAYMDQFLVLNVNRNQVRKDLARCMAAFHLFHEMHPDSTLYMHSVQNDAGGCLPVQAMLAGCQLETRPAEVVFSDLDLAHPWPREKLNRIYNACDLLVSTAYGEGWGLTTTEAMCAGVPVMVPLNTANLDILGENRLDSRVLDFDRARGWGVRSGGDIDHTTYIYQHGGSPVPHVHTDSFVQTLTYIYYHRDEAKQKAKEARTWCQQNTWTHREQNWEQLLRLIESQSTLTTASSV